jgi:hypothetical protein
MFPSWLFVKHEDLSADPINQFRLIYGRLGLKFTQKAENTILEYSAAHNPVEREAGSGARDIKRSSKDNIRNWKTRLSREEIALIRHKTSGIADLFYADNEW